MDGQFNNEAHCLARNKEMGFSNKAVDTDSVQREPIKKQIR